MEKNHIAAEFPTMSEYDGKKAKVRCSIQWIISEAYKDDKKISKILPQCDIAQVFESDGGLKKSISHLLSSGEPYCKITSKMFNLVQPLKHHEDVIQILCSKGMYVLDEADSLITANDLKKTPLALGSHLTIIDMLMFAYLSSKLISVNSLVMTVRKFSEFSASKELPDNLEEALMLWLNKISLKVQINHRNSLESDKHTFGQQTEDDSHFPCISNLTEDLYDGRSLALLLHYYCPNHVLLRDISLKDPISIADAWNNLQLVFDFCNNVLLPVNSTLRSVISPAVLHPVDLLYCGHEMKLNVMLLLATFYHYLETYALEDVVSPLGHTVLYRRQRDHSFEDISNGVAHHSAPTFITSQDKRQQTLTQASQLVPGVQPLISDATRQSFRRPTPDIDSVSTITLTESEGRGSPAPFSTKPLLVRRNRDPQHPLLSPTSKPYMRTPVQHLPIIKNQHRQEFADENDSSSSEYHPLHKTSSHQGLYDDLRSDRPQPPLNRWHLRTNPLMDLRNTNTSNNSYVHRHDGYSTDRSTLSKTNQDANSSLSSDLLSNVEMDTENETLVSSNKTAVSHRSRIAALGDLTPSSDFSYIATSEFHSPFTPQDNSRNQNDMVLESARTSELNSARSQPTITTESSTASDLTSVSSRTVSSNEIGSQDLTQSRTNDAYSSRDVPTLIVADESPDLPRNVTRVKPYHDSDAGGSVVSAPTSQKSYTIQNREFNTEDSARAAGYPIIESSSQNQQRPRRVAPDMQSSHSSTYNSQRLKNSATNGSGDRGRPTPMKAGPIPNMQDEMVIGGTVVKLRSPKKKSDRIVRNVKASSWMEENDKKVSQPEEQQKRHSQVSNADRVAAAFKKLDQRRLDIWKRQIMEKRQQIELEKRLERKEWGRRCLLITKEWATSLAEPSSEHRQPEKQTGSNHTPRSAVADKVPNKNEETSSDYSSKSPSPSSLNAVNNTEGKESANRNVARQHRNLDDVSAHHNFFASPLSTTTYAASGPSPTSHQRNQSFESTGPLQRNSLGQHNTFDAVGRENASPQPPIAQPRDKTYNVSMSHRSAFASPHGNNVTKSKHSSSKNQSHDRTLMSSQVQSFTPPSTEKRHELWRNVGTLPPGGAHGNVTYDIPPQEKSALKQDNKDSNAEAQIHSGRNSSGHKKRNSTVGSRQMTYDVSGQFDKDSSNVAQASSSPAGAKHPAEPSTSAVDPPSQYPDINILQPLPTEHTTRRTLFPTAGPQDLDVSAEQENINPNHLTVGRADQTTYDSFSHKIAGIGSNQSTPHKWSPSQAQDIVTPPKGDGESDMSSVLLKTADRDRKGGRGFELVDETTPNADLAKKKEQFLLKQLKKEQELKIKKADREKMEEKRKEEARQKQEELAAKKEEEKLKRQQILEEYKKRKIQQEEAQLMQQSSTIISGGSGKKHPKPESAMHAGRIGKASRSGRSSPVPNSQPLVARTYSSPNLNSPSGENQSTFLVSGAVDKNANMVPFRRRKQSPARRDWETESASSSAVSSEYTGPKLYKQPSSKSNKHIVYNAICHCCLPGKVNEPQRNSTIQVLEMVSEKHLMILFRDAKCQYRALYTYDPDEERLHRISGNGPLNIVPNMIERLFKYNSGRKAFTALSSKTLSVSIDGITIKNALWQKKTSAKK